MLFEISKGKWKGKGIKIRNAKCDTYGIFEPWWNIDQGGDCKYNLTEGKIWCIKKYMDFN